MTDYLQQFVDSLELDTEPEPDIAPALPSYLNDMPSLEIRIIPAIAAASVPLVSLDEARLIIWTAMLEYAALTNPDHILLIRAQPGVGKTHSAMRLAEYLIAQGRRVLYLSPRHDFIADLRNIAQNPLSIYEWMRRQKKKADDDLETCRHAPDMESWLRRGHESLKFCLGVCGGEYRQKLCPYYAQEKRKEPIVMGQHQHLTTGLPIDDFAFVIGDESPISAFFREWVIPGRWVMPSGMDMAEPFTEIMHELSKLVAASKELDMFCEGHDLLMELGGAQHVLDAVKPFVEFYVPKIESPYIDDPKAVEDVPYMHLPHLARLLYREAQAAVEGREYPHRIIVEKGNLLLLLRNEISDRLPKHIVWLDATGNEHIYRELFGKPVKVVDPMVKPAGRIVQVAGRMNNRSKLLDKESGQTAKVGQLEQQIKHIIDSAGLKRFGIVTYKDLADRLGDGAESALHFYGARGTNDAENVDGLIVAGTPQPSSFAIDRQARMIFFDRMTPFNNVRMQRDVAYNYHAGDGTGRAYPTNGYWQDDDLQSVLWQNREAEIIQSVHRSRLTVRDVTVWLLSSLPVAELPLSELLTIRDVFGAPEGVNVHLWARLLEAAKQHDDLHGGVTVADIMRLIDVGRVTAEKYFGLLASDPDWEKVSAVTQRKRGRPPQILRQILG